MNKTDFAELKEKLTEFNEHNESFSFGLSFKLDKNPPSYIRVIEWKHDKSAVIISELIEIIKLQSEALEAQPRYDMSENPPRETYAFKTAQQALSETNTRLQKLRDGNNGNTTN